jgi:hypothetical protein
LGVGVLLIAVAVAMMCAMTDLGHEYSYGLTGAALVGLAIMFGGLLYLDITKCPQCAGRLGFQIANQYRIGRRVDFCPFCGVAFDKCEMRNTG